MSFIEPPHLRARFAFSAELQRRLEGFLDERIVFSDELLAPAGRAEAGGGLRAAQADRFIALATQAFGLAREPRDARRQASLDAVRRALDPAPHHSWSRP